MSLKAATSRLAAVPVLLALIAVTSCSAKVYGSDSIRIDLEGWTRHGVEHCKRSFGPNVILKDISVQDEDGTEVAHRTVRGRDAAVKVQNNGRCHVRAHFEVGGLQEGHDYLVVADGERQRYEYFRGDCYSDEDSRGWPTPQCWGFGLAPGEKAFLPRGTVLRDAGISGLLKRGLIRVREIARMWHLDMDRVRDIAERPDFPDPAAFVGKRKFWLPEDLEAWRVTQGDLPRDIQSDSP